MADRKEKGKHSKSLVTISLLSVALPVLYVLGAYYRAGYFSAIGLSSDLFPKTVAEVLMYPMHMLRVGAWDIVRYASNNILTVLWVGVAIIALMCLVVFVISGDGFNQKSEKAWRLIVNKRYGKPLIFYFLINLTGLALFVVFIYISFLLIQIPQSAYSSGRHSASRAMAELEKCRSGDIKSQCVCLYEGGSLLAAGRLMAASNQHVALFDGEKTAVYFLPGKRLDGFVPPVGNGDSGDELEAGGKSFCSAFDFKRSRSADHVKQ